MVFTYIASLSPNEGFYVDVVCCVVVLVGGWGVYLGYGGLEDQSYVSVRL